LAYRLAAVCGRPGVRGLEQRLQPHAGRDDAPSLSPLARESRSGGRHEHVEGKTFYGEA